jgi:hypothetical protein
MPSADHAQQRWRRPDRHGLKLPLAILVCNFTPPVAPLGRLRPALLRMLRMLRQMWIARCPACASAASTCGIAAAAHRA